MRNYFYDLSTPPTPPFFTLVLLWLLSCSQPASVDELCPALSSCPDLAVWCGLFFFVFVLTSERRCNETLRFMSPVRSGGNPAPDL